MREYFGGGSIRPDRSDQTVKYEVRDIASLMRKIVPHFEAYPLMSAKQRDFEKFAAVCRLVRAGSHLTPCGWQEVVLLAMTMNASGRRKFTAEDIIGPGELKVIVSASSDGGDS